MVEKGRDLGEVRDPVPVSIEERAELLVDVSVELLLPARQLLPTGFFQSISRRDLRRNQARVCVRHDECYSKEKGG